MHSTAMANFDLLGKGDFYVGEKTSALLPSFQSLTLTSVTKKNIAGTAAKGGVRYDFRCFGKFNPMLLKNNKTINRGIVSALFKGIDLYYTDPVTGNLMESVAISGVRIRGKSLAKAFKNAATIFAFERKLLSGKDVVTGSTEAEGAVINTWGGDDKVEVYSGYSHVRLGAGNDRIDSFSSAKVLVHGGRGRDVFSPGLNGFMMIEDYEKGIDKLDLGFTPNTRQTTVAGEPSLSLINPVTGSTFAVLVGVTSL